MLIEHQQNGPTGFFYTGQPDKPAAQMTYHMAPGSVLVIEHTEVSDALRGQQAGYKLVDSAVEYARANHLTIRPLCPFAAAVFKKKPEYADVLAKN